MSHQYNTSNNNKFQCVYCNSTNYQIVAEQADLRFFPDELFYICHCNECGILFTAPRLSNAQLDKYYPEECDFYHNREHIDNLFHSISQFKKQRNRRWLIKMKLENLYSYFLHNEIFTSGSRYMLVYSINSFIRMLMNLMKRHTYYVSLIPNQKSKPRILYIGSGSGNFIPKNHIFNNYDIHTIDINEQICRAYRNHGINANFGTIEQFDYPEGFFDVIYFSHVIEHLLNPAVELGILSRWLSEQGVMVCAFPVYGTWEWNLGKIYYDVPRHQIHLTKESSNHIFKEANLCVKKCINLPYGWGLYFNSLRNDYDRNGFEGLWDKPFKLRYYIMSYMMSFFHNSGNMLYYLTKGDI